jgi:pyridoxal phosphate enzyme (YggS family)
MTTTESIDYRARLAQSLPVVQARIAAAAEAAGRAEADVRLVAVSKAHPVSALEAALEAGLQDLGENRVEELEHKIGVLGRGAATWHMIGHVQGRKAGTAAALADLVHSVDSIKLAERLARFGDERARVVRVLAQVNVSGEEQKSGFRLDAAVEEIHRLSELQGLKVDGLMTMAPFVDDEVVLGRTFQRLRETLEKLRALTDEVGRELSMGMTNDLDIAIREGSTMVRIGTALFGERIR